MEHLQATATRLFGSRRVVTARATFDRYNAAGGGLLAAGIAYNTLFALIPMAIFASGVIGLLISDRAAREAASTLLIGWAPPLADLADQIVGGLVSSSSSLSLLGLVGTAWGSTRLFASLEVGIEAMFSGVPRPGLVARTLRRLIFVVVIAGLVVAAIAASSAAALVAELEFVDSPAEFTALVWIVSIIVPVGAASGVLTVIYRVVPPARPPWLAISVPAIAVGIVLVALTRIFAIIAPRILGANVVFGTLGAIFVGLAWLGLVYTVILLGAAWVRERMLGVADSASVA